MIFRLSGEHDTCDAYDREATNNPSVDSVRPMNRGKFSAGTVCG